MTGHARRRGDGLADTADQVDALRAALEQRDAALREARADAAEARQQAEEIRDLLDEVQGRFTEVWAATPVGLALSNERGEYMSVNDALCRILGRDADDLVGRTSMPFTHPDDVDLTPTTPGASEAPPGSTRVEKRYVRPDGGVRWARVTLTPIAGPAGAAWTVVCVDDITDRRRAERTLQDSEQNLSAVARVTRRIQAGEDARSTIIDAVHDMTGAQSACLVERLDDDTYVVTASAGSTLEGTTIANRRGTALAEAFRDGHALFLDDPVGNRVVAPAALAAEIGSLMWQPVLRGDEPIAVIIVKWPYRVDRVAERTARAVELLADETSVALVQEEMRAELHALAHTDPLTNLPNRRTWDEQLAVLGEVARVTGDPAVVALIDLDHFKAYNDRHGHHAGDDHLREFARRARATLRGTDLLTRWGGEEFAVALPACAEADAGPILNQLRHAVPGDQTCSIGWAAWDGVEPLDELLARVDDALYAAKEAGRDRIVRALRRSTAQTA